MKSATKNKDRVNVYNMRMNKAKSLGYKSHKEAVISMIESKQPDEIAEIFKLSMSTVYSYLTEAGIHIETRFLSDSDVVEIYNDQETPSIDLSLKHNVSVSHINGIRSGNKRRDVLIAQGIIKGQFVGRPKKKVEDLKPVMCLKCDKLFKPTGKFLRLCPEHRAINSRISEFDTYRVQI